MLLEHGFAVTPKLATVLFAADLVLDDDRQLMGLFQQQDVNAMLFSQDSRQAEIPQVQINGRNGQSGVVGRQSFLQQSLDERRSRKP